VGEHLKYFGVGARAAGRLSGMVLGPRHLGSRDRYIGWSAEDRRRNVRFLAYNTRFLILPWVKVEHLASHILGRMGCGSPRTGSGSTDIRSTSWRRLWIPNDSAEPVTVRPTGWCWARRRDVVNNAIATCRTGRSKRFWISVGEAVSRAAHGVGMKTPDAYRCEPGRTKPGTGRSPASAVERGTITRSSRRHCMRWRRCWCGRGTRRRPARCWKKWKVAETGAETQPESNASPSPGHGRKCCRGRFAVRGRLRLRTPS